MNTSNARDRHLQLRKEVFLGVLLALSSACDRKPPADSVPDAAPPSASTVDSSAPAPSTSLPPVLPAKRTLRLVAAGDVSFGRLVGQMLLQNPQFAPLASVDPLFRTADIRFVNLEGPISDRGKETVSPENKLVFNGPPISASALSRARVDIVSTANNHAWDYGRKGLLETLDFLDKEKIFHVGSGENLEKAWTPVVVERSGFRLAFVAVNDIWNQAHVPGNSARDHVAGMDKDKLVGLVRELRRRDDVDAIAVSYHGGVEYQDEPLTTTRDLARAAIEAGADVFLGHHPHVVQGIAFHRDRPIVYSLGNLLMRMTGDHPATEMGLAVRVTLRRGEVPELVACPIRISGVDPIPLGSDPRRTAYESMFMQRLRKVTRLVGQANFEAFDAEGCSRVTSGERSP